MAGSSETNKCSWIESCIGFAYKHLCHRALDQTERNQPRLHIEASGHSNFGLQIGAAELHQPRPGTVRRVPNLWNKVPFPLLFCYSW